MSEEKIKVLTVKLGLDMHNRGILVVNRILRDAGMEVVFIGAQFPAGIVEAALQEDVDVIGVSSLSSASTVEYIERLTDLLREKGLEHKLLIVGGIILPDDVPQVKEMGVDEYFPPGSAYDSIIDYVKQNAFKKVSESG
ncbi:MAG: cobalamin B12-binding domain-containing protein [Dehalococcoidia bacterium]|nr:cobalamin B12-binding domain-containing protein [Dehalococcoidia bacterium]